MEIIEVTDPDELARDAARRQRYERNWSWWKAQLPEAYERYRGKHLIISGQEVFAADTSQEAWALAKAAHPDDDGRFPMTVPRERLPHIHAHRR